MRKFAKNLTATYSVLNELTSLYCRRNVMKFKPLELPGLDHNPIVRKKPNKLERLRPRYLNMSGDEEWTNVWPAARSFNYNVVPLPIRQGYVKNNMENNNIVPEKYANVELLKIPNFLHLTPVHIAKHCNALKKFCTKWPEELNNDVIKKHFPLEFKQTDYIHSGPSIRDERARVVTLKFELKNLKFDERERFKFIQLVGPKRYDEATDTVTILADRCPSHRQNYDYLIYVLTALTSESKKFESWELEISESDWLKFKWDKSQFKENFDLIVEKPQIKSEIKDNRTEIETLLKSSIEKLYNDGDSVDSLEQYKSGVLKLLNLDNKLSAETGGAV